MFGYLLAEPSFMLNFCTTKKVLFTPGKLLSQLEKKTPTRPFSHSWMALWFALKLIPGCGKVCARFVYFGRALYLFCFRTEFRTKMMNSPRPPLFFFWQHTNVVKESETKKNGKTLNEIPMNSAREEWTRPPCAFPAEMLHIVAGFELFFCVVVADVEQNPGFC